MCDQPMTIAGIVARSQLGYEGLHSLNGSQVACMLADGVFVRVDVRGDENPSGKYLLPAESLEDAA